MRQRSFYSWGWADAQATPQEVAALERGVGSRFGIGNFDVVPTPARRGDRAAQAAPDRCPARSSDFCTTAHLRPPAAQLRQVVLRQSRACSRASSRTRPTWSPFRAARPTSRPCSTGASSATPSRSPTAAASSVVGGVEPPDSAERVVTIDLSELDRVLEIDAISRAARIQGGVLGPALEDQLKPARAHAAPLPAVLRVLDARRLDRDALRRALRDALHPHRRLRRKSLRVVTPAGVAGVAPPARLGRRAEPGPACSSAPRASSASSPKPGCALQDAADASAPRPRVALRRFLRRRRGRARHRPGRRSIPRTAGCSTRSEAADTPAPATATAAVLVLAFESADHPMDAWMQRALEIARDARRHAADAEAPRDDRGRTARGRGRRVARQAFLRVPYARRAGRARHHRRDVRDRDHVGALPRTSTRSVMDATRQRDAAT